MKAAWQTKPSSVTIAPQRCSNDIEAGPQADFQQPELASYFFGIGGGV